MTTFSVAYNSLLEEKDHPGVRVNMLLCVCKVEHKYKYKHKHTYSCSILFYSVLLSWTVEKMG